MGDYNFNLLNSGNSKVTSDFTELLFSYSFVPLINKPTRVKETSATLIDNILCNDIQNKTMINGIMYTDISDHFPVFSVYKRDNEHFSSGSITRRLINKGTIQEFKNKLASTEWLNVVDGMGCQDAFSKFHDVFSSYYNESFPLRTVKTTYRNRKCWLTKGLKQSIKIKNKLYILSIKNDNAENKRRYLDHKRLLNRLLRNAERDHYDQLLRQNSGNIKKSWEIIKEVINRKQSPKKTKEFTIDGNIVDNNRVIADAFNNFYLNIGSNISKSLPAINKTHSSFMANANPNSMFVTPTDREEIRKIVINLKKKCPGWDDINCHVIKEACPLILDVLTLIINMSLSEGVFPSKLKTAKVVPLFKSGDSGIVNNYRPVSVLSVFSKIFERIMYNRLITFINDNDILYKYQFGFKKVMVLN